VLVLVGSRGAFPDHLDQRVAHVLPDGLALADLLVLRYAGDGDAADGGLLRLRLIPTLPVGSGREVRPVAFEAGRARLRMRLPGDPDALAGRWEPLAIPGGDILIPAVTLTSHEAQVVQALAEGGGAVVEVEVELRYRGVHPGLPWLATPGAALHEELARRLAPEPVPASLVRAVVAGLPAETWAMRALVAGAPAPDPDALADALTARVLDAWFEPVEAADEGIEEEEDRVATSDERRVVGGSGARDGFLGAVPLHRLRAEPAVTGPWDLAVLRTEARTHRLTWSLGDAVAALPAEVRARAFPRVIVASLVAADTVHVVNGLPVTPDGVRAISVELGFLGASGLPEHATLTFDGSRSVQRVALPRFAGRDPRLRRRIDLTVASTDGGWPRRLRGTEAAVAGAVVEVSAATAGVDVVRIDARPDVFSHADALDVAITRSAAATAGPPPAAARVGDAGDGPLLATVRLDAAVPGLWLALPGVAPHERLEARVTAHAGDRTLALAPRPLIRPSLVVTAGELEPVEPDVVRFELADERIVFAAVTVRPPEGGAQTYRTVDETGAAVPVFRRSLLAPLAYEWRAEIVARDAPLTQGPWTAGTAPLVRLSPTPTE
jgi:hypothetical protein